MAVQQFSCMETSQIMRSVQKMTPYSAAEIKIPQQTQNRQTDGVNVENFDDAQCLPRPAPMGSFFPVETDTKGLYTTGKSYIH